MQGFWHITAIATCASMLFVLTNHLIFFILAFLWLVLLKLFKRLNTLPFYVSLTALIFFLYYIPTPVDSFENEMDDLTVHLTGKIVSNIDKTDQKIQFSLQKRSTRKKYLIVHFSKDDKRLNKERLQTLKYGATCQLKGRLNKPQSARNPGEFDYYKYLLERGIKAQVIVHTLEDVKCQGASIFHPIFQLRQILMHDLNQGTEQRTAAWIQALVLGDRSQLTDEMVDLFQRWGLSHLLAISGLHVGIIVASLYFILVQTSLLTKERAKGFLIAFVPIYAIVAGGEPSVLRASLMIFLFLIANKMKLSLDVLDTISIVFLMLILFDPFVVYHIGFQFSFLVTFALILSRHWLSQTESPFWQLLFISYVSQMIILPLQFQYFHTFHPLSIFANLIIVPYFSFFVIPLMFLLIPLIYLLPKVAHWLVLIFEPLQNLLEKVLFFIDQQLYTPLVIGEFPWLAAMIYYIAFIFSLKLVEQGNFLKAFQYSLIFIGVIMWLIFQPYFSNKGTITMLDVGQGDTFIIELPYRRGVIFVDAAASVSFDHYEVTDDIYQRIIKPFLYSRGIHTVDAIILSHSHVDHNGSTQWVVEDFNTKLLLVSEFYEFKEKEQRLIDERDVSVVRLKAPNAFKLKGQTFEVLSPETNEHDTDDNSLVLRSAFGNRQWLFTGDISEAIERKITKRYNERVVDVLKVAHHGSNTSTDEGFIDHFKPTVALISVGENNSYGHPHLDVIKTLKEAKVNILRTDELGAVQYIFTEEKGTFLSFLP